MASTGRGKQPTLTVRGCYVLALCLFVSGGLILAIPAAMLGRKAKAADAAAKVESL